MTLNAEYLLHLSLAVPFDLKYPVSEIEALTDLDNPGEEISGKVNKDFYRRCSNQLLSRFTSNENNYNRLLSTLPDLVANFVSDVVDKGVTASVVQVALNLNYLEYGQYEIVRLIATSDLKKPPRCEVLALIVKMIESI